MSRSYKHTPICGHTTATTEKFNKFCANKKFRFVNKQILKSIDLSEDIENIEENECMFKEVKEVSNIYNFEKDGKSWFYHPKEFPENISYYNKLMRK